MQKRPQSTLVVSKILTPAFVIESDLHEHNLKKLAYIKEKTRCAILHALKAWCTPQFLEVEKKYIDGTEVSSLYEARLGYEKFGKEVHIFSPAYKDEEFMEILTYSSTIIFNSFSQWKKFKPRVEAFVTESGIQRECGLRINPEIVDVDEYGGVWSPCTPGSRLGIRANEFRDALARDPLALEGISGLHVHIFFEKDAQDFENALFSIEAEFGQYISQVKWLNLGGGQKITDDAYDSEKLISCINRLKARYSIQVHLEPGAAIAWHIGTLVASVLDIVERDDVNYKIPILDISFENHLTDFFANPALELTVRGARRTTIAEQGNFLYRFGGSTCIAGDVTHDVYSLDHELKIGDKIVFENAIQYTLIKSTFFNGIQHPSIVKWGKGEPEVIRSFSYNDFLTRMG